MNKRKLVVLTGAGISAESGLKTFRDSNGLWENHAVEEVATPEAWQRNPTLVNRFYNERRNQLKGVSPNDGHHVCVELEEYFDVMIITQNVDDLHERAGSSRVLHLHGELNKVRSTVTNDYILSWEGPLSVNDVDQDGHPLRPHIVWFGETVPMLEIAIQEVLLADIIIVVGSSMQVYPAAALVGYSREDCDVFYVDPRPTISPELARLKRLSIIEDIASNGMKKVKEILLSQ